MSNKTVGYIFLIIVVVLVVAVCNAAGPEDQPTAPESTAPSDTTEEEVAFNLKAGEGACDFVCVASHWLSKNAQPIDELAVEAAD